MIEIWREEYWSKADAFLLPLTGLKREQPYEMKSYLFWNEHTITDYKLIITFSYEDYEGFLKWCREELFPVLNKKCLVIESYDRDERTIMVVDISVWAPDVEQFLKNRYSQFSNKGKERIEEFHGTIERVPGPTPGSIRELVHVPVHIFAVLYPGVKMAILDNLTPIAYISKHFNIPEEEMERIGEVGSKYDKFVESLFTDIDSICQSDSKEKEE